MTRKLAFCAAAATAVLCTTVIAASAQTYEVTKLVPGSAFHGVHGLGIDKGGRLFAGSVAGAALYEVDRAAGTAKISISTADGGMADDVSAQGRCSVAVERIRTGAPAMMEGCALLPSDSPRRPSLSRSVSPR